VSSITIVSDAPNCGVTYDCHYDACNSFIIQATDWEKRFEHSSHKAPKGSMNSKNQPTEILPNNYYLNGSDNLVYFDMLVICLLASSLFMCRMTCKLIKIPNFPAKSPARLRLRYFTVCNENVSNVPRDVFTTFPFPLNLQMGPIS
jgi:hypothetical protein